MLKLRKEHLDAFETQAINLFTARVVAHVQAVWPAESAELGPALLAETVRYTILRGAAQRLSTEYDLVRFVDLAFLLAQDFDTNPLSGWTRPILADRTLAPSDKLDRLYKKMEDEFTIIERRKAGKK